MLLPDLKGVDTSRSRSGIAKSKAGIDEDDEVDLYRFEVQRYISGPPQIERW